MPERVLISSAKRGSGGQRIYHKPDPANSDIPCCSRVQLAREWYVKDLSQIPNHRPCKICYGEIQRSHKGPELAAKLAKMDPDEVSG